MILAGGRCTRRQVLARLARGATLCALGGAPLACAPQRAPIATPAAGRPRIARVGYLATDSGTTPDDPLGNLRAGLRELGYDEGTNLTIEYRTADGQEERLPGLVTELVQLPTDLIVLADTRPIPVAAWVTRTVPLVMMYSIDPVGQGFAQSLARPGGNLTGLASFNLSLIGKQIELLREAVPSTRAVAVLFNLANRLGPLQWEAAQAAATSLGLQLVPIRTDSREQLDTVLGQPLPDAADALYVLPDVIFLARVRQVVAFAARNRLPGMYGSAEFVRAGGLMAYVPDRAAMFRRAAYYVDRVLKGASPADLPIELPTKFELSVSRGAARDLGIELPRELLLDVTDIID